MGSWLVLQLFSALQAPQQDRASVQGQVGLSSQCRPLPRPSTPLPAPRRPFLPSQPSSSAQQSTRQGQLKSPAAPWGQEEAGH